MPPWYWLMLLAFIVPFAGGTALYIWSMRRDRAKYGPLLGSIPAPVKRAGYLRVLLCLAIVPIVWFGVAAGTENRDTTVSPETEV